MNDFDLLLSRTLKEMRLNNDVIPPEEMNYLDLRSYIHEAAKFLGIRDERLITSVHLELA
jgi:hypothetical protein